MKEEKKSGNGAAFPRATERERGGQRGEGSTVPIRPCARPSAGSNGLGSLVPILRVSAGCGAQPPNSVRTTPRRELSGERLGWGRRGAGGRRELQRNSFLNTWAHGLNSLPRTRKCPVDTGPGEPMFENVEI